MNRDYCYHRIQGSLTHINLYHLEPDTCNDNPPTPEYKLPVETRLVKCLRAWRDDPNGLVDEHRTVEQEICDLLEWYICECISYGPNNLGGWWSDGVVYLEIEESLHDAFSLLGVTWIDCKGIAPFDIDVVLDPNRDDSFANCIFRIGMLDRHGQPIICDRDRSPQGVLDRRPRQNRDWAMAVELSSHNKY